MWLRFPERQKLRACASSQPGHRTPVYPRHMTTYLVALESPNTTI